MTMDKNNMKSLVIDDDVANYFKSCDKSKKPYNVTIPEETTSPKDEETNVCTKEKKNSRHTLNSKHSLLHMQQESPLDYSFMIARNYNQPHLLLLG